MRPRDMGPGSPLSLRNHTLMKKPPLEEKLWGWKMIRYILDWYLNINNKL